MDKETEAEGLEGEDGRRRQEGAEGDEGRRRQRGHAKTNSVSEKERKIGHRRINEEGQVSHIGKKREFLFFLSRSIITVPLLSCFSTVFLFLLLPLFHPLYVRFLPFFLRRPVF